MVEELNLQTLAYPYPYNIQWLNQGKWIQVNSRCFISLSISKKHHDELYCDIISIDS